MDKQELRHWNMQNKKDLAEDKRLKEEKEALKEDTTNDVWEEFNKASTPEEKERALQYAESLVPSGTVDVSTVSAMRSQADVSPAVSGNTMYKYFMRLQDKKELSTFRKDLEAEINARQIRPQDAKPIMEQYKKQLKGKGSDKAAINRERAIYINSMKNEILTEEFIKFPDDAPDDKKRLLTDALIAMNDNEKKGLSIEESFKRAMKSVGIENPILPTSIKGVPSSEMSQPPLLEKRGKKIFQKLKKMGPKLSKKERAEMTNSLKQIYRRLKRINKNSMPKSLPYKEEK